MAKDYIYRNDETGMEVKGPDERPELAKEGYKLHQIIDYKITEEEKKAK